MRDINIKSKEKPWPKTGVTHYYAKLELPIKGSAIEGLVVCNSWDVFKGMVLHCYQRFISTTDYILTNF